MNIILIGPQGSGKGTISQLLTQDFGIPQISTGDIFRAAASRNKTLLEKEIKKYMDSKDLVPDELTINVVNERLSQNDCKKGFILDGFPRTLNQAIALDGIKNLTIDCVIELSVPDGVSLKRLSARLTCSKCNTVYGFGNPPKQKTLCDSCGGVLIQRDDDKPEFIKKRLEVYHKQTTDVLGFYKKKGLLYTIDATRSVKDVYASVKKILIK